MGDQGFLAAAPPSEGADHLFAGDAAKEGFVMNLTGLWAHVPDARVAIGSLLDTLAGAASLTARDRGLLTAAAASTFGDSYCSLAWGTRLARHVGPHVAAQVLAGRDTWLGDRDRALARWARRVTADANATTTGDVDELRDVGLSDTEIFAITAFVAVRVAFSTINDALGALPDHTLAERAPHPVLDAVAFGRPIGTGSDQWASSSSA